MQFSSPLSSLTSLLPSCATLLKLARLSRFVLRTPRKIFPDQILRAVLLSLCEGIPHFRAIAENISSLNQHDPSRQAVSERLSNEAAPSFFFLVFQQVLAEQTKRFLGSNITHQIRKTLEDAQGLFDRLIIEDGSVLPLHQSLVEVFRGSANQHGESAALRLRWAFDFLTGQTIDAELHPWRDNDQSTAFDLLSHLRAGDLVLRDMGYFCLQCLETIAALGAFFLTRIPDGTVLGDEDGNRFDLARWLGKAAQEGLQVVERQVRVGSGGELAGRLVAARIDPKKAQEKRRQLKAQCREKGRAARRAELTMCDWVVVLTNVDASQLDGRKVAQLYRARWMVEIFFKGMKSGQDLESWSAHRTNENTIQCLAYAQMIIGVLSLNLWRVLGRILLAKRGQSGGDGKSKQKKERSQDEKRALPTAGPITSFEMLMPLLAKVFEGTLRGAELRRQLCRIARYAAHEPRRRLSLDALVFDLLT